MMDRPDIDFGIVNYNGGDALLACVRSILGQSGIGVRVFVCDNASADGSLEQLRQSGMPCSLDETGVNLGYAGACNRLLAKMDAPIQVLCNMDLTFDSDWGVQVQEAFRRHAECGSVASLVLEAGDIVNAVGVRFHRDMHAVNESSGLPLATATGVTEKKVFGCYGAVMAFRREAASAVGPMDESFFLFYEETEWYLRHNLHGFSTIFAPQAIVRHERSRTTVRYSTFKLYYAERNRVRCALVYMPLHQLALLPFYSVQRYWQMAKGGIPGQDASGKKNRKWQLVTTLLKAWVLALLSWPEQWRKARQLRKRLGPTFKNRALAILRHYPS